MGIEHHGIWNEKYRPTSLDSYIGNEHLKSKVSIFIETNDPPHLLFYGRSGTGKTTLSKIIANSIECDYLYINASDENSVDVVREKIKGFASTLGFQALKVIILDECDYITPNAQAALRNLMETFSRHCRFILTCNYVERIIDPIQSRCQSFQIVPPSKKEVAIHLSDILTKENVKFEVDDIATITINLEVPPYAGQLPPVPIDWCMGQILDLNTLFIINPTPYTPTWTDITSGAPGTSITANFIPSSAGNYIFRNTIAATINCPSDYEDVNVIVNNKPLISEEY